MWFHIDSEGFTGNVSENEIMRLFGTTVNRSLLEDEKLKSVSIVEKSKQIATIRPIE